MNMTSAKLADNTTVWRKVRILACLLHSQAEDPLECILKNGHDDEYSSEGGFNRIQ